MIKRTKKVKAPETVSVTYKELEVSLYDPFKALCDRQGKKYKIAIGDILRKGINEELKKFKGGFNNAQ